MGFGHCPEDEIIRIRCGSVVHVDAHVGAAVAVGIIAIINSWPRSFKATRAQNLGFRAEHSFDEIIQVYLDEEFGGKFPGQQKPAP